MVPANLLPSRIRQDGQSGRTELDALSLLKPCEWAFRTTPNLRINELGDVVDHFHRNVARLAVFLFGALALAGHE